jgi:hypothetical protein
MGGVCVCVCEKSLNYMLPICAFSCTSIIFHWTYKIINSNRIQLRFQVVKWMEIKFAGTEEHMLYLSEHCHKEGRLKKENHSFSSLLRWRRPTFSLSCIYFSSCSSKVKYISVICFLVMFFPRSRMISCRIDMF